MVSYYKGVHYAYITNIPDLQDLASNAFPKKIYDYGYFMGTIGITSRMYLLTYNLSPNKYIWDEGPKFLINLGLKYDKFYRDGKLIQLQLHIHKNKVQALKSLLKIKKGV